ncbi:MAG: type II toxin-antitoxin system VapC family toxin [Deltaproteobacteria bacterium]|nr:type II toxin-antitoxin system VapC family toxin [Deltaproteobacteria bacterium]
MKEKVYIETSIISFLTSKPSQNLIAAAWQSITVDWWEKRKSHFDIFISELVYEEATRGDPFAVSKRIEVIKEIPYLQITDEAINLAKMIIKPGPLPKKASNDALHLAIAAVHKIDYLMTWNCRHLDNAELKPKVRNLLLMKDFNIPEICTPQELLGGNKK